MPRIPQYQAEVGQNFGEAPQSSGAAGRIQGQSMEALGQGLQNLGESVTKYQQVEAERKKASEANTRAILANAARQKANEIGDTVENETYLNADAAGQNMDANFTKAYKKQTAALTKDVSDPLLKTQIEAYVLDSYNDRRKGILQASRKMEGEFSLQQYEGQLNTSTGAIMRNPTDFQKEYTAYTNMISQSALSEPNKVKAIKLAGEKMARSAVIGLAEAGEYDVAKKVIAGPLSQFIKPEDQEKLTEEIAKRRGQAVETAIKEQDREFKKTKQAKEDLQAQNFRGRMKDINDFIASGETVDAVQAREWEKRVDGDIERGDLERTEGDWLKTTFNKIAAGVEKEKKEEIKTKQDSRLAELSFKIGTSDNLKALRNEIIAAETRNELDPKDAINAIRYLDSEEDRRAARARANKTIKDPYFGIATKTLEKLYPSSTFGVPNPKNTKEGAEAAFNFLHNYNDNPKTRGNAEKSLQLTLRKFKGGGLPGKIPFVPNAYQDISTPEKEAAAVNMLKQMQGENKISKSEYLESLRELKNKKLLKKEGK